MENVETKWLSIEKQPRPESRKTDTWHVFNKEYRSYLGEIKWYGPWRKYTFWPNPDTIYEATCLADITKFLQDVMLERKIEKQNG